MGAKQFFQAIGLGFALIGTLWGCAAPPEEAPKPLKRPQIIILAPPPKPPEKIPKRISIDELTQAHKGDDLFGLIHGLEQAHGDVEYTVGKGTLDRYKTNPNSKMLQLAIIQFGVREKDGERYLHLEFSNRNGIKGDTNATPIFYFEPKGIYHIGYDQSKMILMHTSISNQKGPAAKQDTANFVIYSPVPRILVIGQKKTIDMELQGDPVKKFEMDLYQFYRMDFKNGSASFRTDSELREILPKRPQPNLREYY